MKTSVFEEDLTLGKQAKFVEERFTATEETMSKLCSSFSVFTKRTAKYRDSNDQLAAALNDYATKEQISKTLKAGMENVAHSLARLGDDRDNSTLYLEEQVMASLTQYSARCKNCSTEIKNIYSAKEKELCKRRQLTKIRQRLPQKDKFITKAQGDLVEACSKVSKLQGSLEEYALAFERSKLDDLKRILADFIKAELSFHIGAVQSLSKALADIDNINIDVDYHAFKNVLVRPNTALRLEIVRSSKALAIGCQRNVGAGIPINLEDSQGTRGIHTEEGGSSKDNFTTDASDVTSAVERENTSEEESSDAEEASDGEFDSTIHIKHVPRT